MVVAPAVAAFELAAATRLRLVFSSGRTGVQQLYSEPPSGGGLRQLTFGQDAACSPHPLPDGRRIGYSSGYGSFGSCGGTIHLATVRGKTLEQLAGYDPAWSRTGEVAYRGAGGEGIFVGHRKVADDGAMPAWSRDGRLAYVGSGGAVSVLSRGRAQVVDARHSRTANPTWSPDGRRLAYAFVDDETRTGGIAVDGRVVFHEDGYGLEAGPSWSPDGKRLAFDDGTNLDVVDLAGRVTTIAPVAARDLAWSPRGDVIAIAEGDRVAVVDLHGAVRDVYRDPPEVDVAWVAWLELPIGAGLRKPEVPTVVKVDTSELDSKLPIGGLAAAGDTVAFSLCGTVATWTPGVAVSVPSAATCSVPIPPLPPSLYAPVPGGTDGMSYTGGIDRFWSLWLDRADKTTVIGNGGGEDIAGDPAVPGAGYLVGGGDTVVFTRWTLGNGGDSFGPGGRPGNSVTSTTLFRLDDSGPVQIAFSAGAYEPLDVDGSRVVVRRRLSGIDVLERDGTRVLSFELGQRVIGAALGGGHLYVLLPDAELRDYDLSGRLLHTGHVQWSDPHLDSEDAFCLRAYCPNALTLRLDGASNGILAYSIDGSGFLQNVDADRLCPLGDTDSLQLTASGLFVASGKTIRFTPASGVHC